MVRPAGKTLERAPTFPGSEQLDTANTQKATGIPSFNPKEGDIFFVSIKNT
ncbi:MAG: hypothetical protein Q6373_024770 [Candidatus Sigynarchaeota archaeon]